MTRTMRLTRTLLASSAAAGALFAGAAANAQEMSDDRSTVVGELVVTADKREMNLQEVPAAVSAVSGDTLTDLKLQSLEDYSGYVPGLNISDGGSPGQAVIVLRGIAPVGPTAVVGAYIDETPTGSSTAYARATEFGLDLLPYDLERFEVLRGPQGTLYGASSMGGLIKYVLRKADPTKTTVQLGGDVSFIDESNGPSNALRGAINIPLVDDKLAIRASAFNSYDQGYIDNVFLSGPQAGERVEDTNNVHQWGGRLAATWRPAENVNVYLQGMLYRQESDDNAQVSLGNVTRTGLPDAPFYNGDPVLGDLTQSHEFLQPFSKEIDYYSGTVEWDAGPVQVVSASGYSKVKTRQTQDATESFGGYPILFGGEQGVSFFKLGLDLEKFTQEFRVVSTGENRLNWIVGAFYTHEKSNNTQLVQVYDADRQPITGPFAPVFVPYFADISLPTIYQEYAVFGNLTFNITDKFDVTGGLRYAKNDQEFTQISDGFILGGSTSVSAESSEDIVTWMANARYRITPDVMVYARVATGYRPGGPNVALEGISPSFESDTLTSYEAGVRSTFWDGRAQLNVTGFNIDWKNIQLSIFNAERTASGLGNAGDAYSRGIEVEGALTPMDGLTIRFNAAYTKAELTEIKPEAPPYLFGYQLPNVPEFSAGLLVDYTWSFGEGWEASVGGGLRYTSEHLETAPIGPDPAIGAAASPNYENPEVILLDLRAGISRNNWELSVFARNVTNERVYEGGYLRENPVTGATPFIDVNVTRPRRIGVSLDFNF